MPITIEGFDLQRYDATEAKRFRQFHIAIAEKHLRRRVARGFDREPVVITDGTPRRDYNQVKLFGVIEFARRTSAAAAVLWGLEELRRISPRGPAAGGHYVDDHIPMINGEQIRGDLKAALMGLKPGDRIQLVNIRVYARKIEGDTGRNTTARKSGKRRRRALSRQAPNGVYRVVLKSLVQRFGRVMFFDFKYVKLNTGIKVWGDAGGRYRRDGSRTFTMRVQRDQVFPALQFFLKDS